MKLLILFLLIFSLSTYASEKKCDDFRSSPTTSFMSENLIAFMALDHLDKDGVDGMREWVSEFIGNTLFILAKQLENNPLCFTDDEKYRYENQVLFLAALIESERLPKYLDLENEIIKIKESYPNRYENMVNKVSKP